MTKRDPADEPPCRPGPSCRARSRPCCSWPARRGPRRAGSTGTATCSRCASRRPVTAVVLARPEHIREVFAGPADTFHAGEGNAILGPIMGEHSVLLLDEKEHLAARKRVMSAFHGAALKSWSEVIERAHGGQRGALADGPPVRRPSGAERHQPRGDPAHRLRDGRRRAAGDSCARCCKKLVQIGPVIFLGWLYPQLSGTGRGADSTSVKARPRRAHLRRDRRPSYGRRSRRAHRRAVEAAGRCAGAERRRNCATTS